MTADRVRVMDANCACDPQPGDPTCDYCGHAQVCCNRDDCWSCADNWNPETGSHRTCEKRAVRDE